MGDLKLSGSECAGAQSDRDLAIRAEEQGYRPPQRPERELTWSGLDTCSTVCFPMRVLRRYYASHICIYIIYKREREKESDRERDRMTESEKKREGEYILN